MPPRRGPDGCFLPKSSWSEAPPPPPPAAAAAAAPPPANDPPPAKVIPIDRRVTLGDLLNTGSIAPPPSTSPPPGPATVEHPPTPVLPAAAPSVSSDVQTFAQIGGKAVTHVGVAICGGIIRRQGLEPQEPDDDDVDRLAAATAVGIQRHLGDREIPWWGPIVVGYSNLYMSMRLGAKPRRTGPPLSLAADPPPADPPPAEDPPPPPPPPPTDPAARIPGKPAPLVS